ncbi:hypothetical protein HQQ94_04725 [Shewanella sp. VB17]|uniref:hypothetical protein n=1 Tax=Shewanella sp. VB17 TaxID=2739432 RepID=UPI00156362F1|nr:hypothetical protein [Shewanella sp. VB17]NRD72557.1 hypothetical protein [Shewanella sp. VB17]
MTKKTSLVLTTSIIALMLAGCGSDDNSENISFESNINQPISGLADGDKITDAGDAIEHHADAENLAVFDDKFRDGTYDTPRFSIVSNNYDEVTVTSIPQTDVSWITDEARGNDIESVCRLDKSHYLAAESSYYQENYGRMFLMERVSDTPNELYSGLKLKAIYSIPTDEDASFEGLACTASVEKDGSYNILLGDRESGDIYWGSVNPLTDSTTAVNERINPDFQKVGNIHADESWDVNRDISELNYDIDTQKLLGVASYDPGDDVEETPHSTLYKTQDTFPLASNAAMAAMVISQPSIAIEELQSFPDHKIEAVTIFKSNYLFYGSDDDTENNIYGMFTLNP